MSSYHKTHFHLPFKAKTKLIVAMVAAVALTSPISAWGIVNVLQADGSYAVGWNQNALHTLRYDANGGDNAPGNQVCSTDDGACAITISLDRPTRSGQVFLGWAKDAAASVVAYQPGDTIIMNGDTTLYAIWRANEPIPQPAGGESAQYILSYDANGGAGAPEGQICTSSSGECEFAVSVTMPMKPGASFTGWSENPNSVTGDIHPATNFKTSHAHTVLYAIYQEIATPTPTGAVSWKRGQNHVKGSGENAIFNIDYALTSFKNIKLNEQTLEKDKDFTITTPADLANNSANNTNQNNGSFSASDNPTSTTITIKSETLDKLQPNSYNIVISFECQDDVHTTMTIVGPDGAAALGAQSTNGGVPNTGENTHIANPALTTICILLPLLAAAFTFVTYRVFQPQKRSPLQYYTYEA